MQVTLGTSGCEKSHQDPFDEIADCTKEGCGGTARLAFVAHEVVGEEPRPKMFVCDLHENLKNGKYWPHDACAVAVYFCEKCFTAVVVWNQA